MRAIGSDFVAATMRLKAFDGLAISLSGLCLLHCLALPILAVSLPLAGVLAEAEWVHWLFVALAAPVSLMALWSAERRRSWTLIALAAGGLSLLIAGAAGWPDHDWETGLTVSGGLLLAGVHLMNWRRSRHVHEET
jgi:hypothetical protein